MHNDRTSEYKGICYLIGAGPSDPGLLTRRGEECLRLADIVYYDYLVSDEILALSHPDSERVCVGKSAGNHSHSQEQINSMIVDQVKSGRIVARLKGGDPFVFGRGGEEAQALAEQGLPFEVVPGVTSAIAAAAYAGIPVTHRGVATAVTFVTGHETPDKPGSQTDWDALAKGGQTLCIYMGTGRLSEIASALISGGRSPEEPAALICSGTAPQQQNLYSTLGRIAEDARKANISPPGVIIVGAVCGLANSLQWRKEKPLTGKCVMVTRCMEQAGKLSAILSGMGAQVIQSPAIKIIPVDTCCNDMLDTSIRDGMVKIAHMREKNPLLLSMLQQSPLSLNLPPFEELISECDSVTKAVAYLVANHHDWVVFTSVNGVQKLWDRLDDFGLDSRVFVGKEIAAIGPATSQALYEHGLHADLIPDVYTSEGLVEALQSICAIRDKKFLLFRASNAGHLLREELQKKGAEVHDLTAYHVGKQQLTDAAKQALANGEVDAITFASAATVRNFFEMTGDILPQVMHLKHRPKLLSIGPVTSAEMLRIGLPPDREAASASAQELARSTAEVLCPGNNE